MGKHEWLFEGSIPSHATEIYYFDKSKLKKNTKRNKKKMLHLTALKAFMVTTNDGSVDYDKSVANFTAQLSEYELRHGEGQTMAGRAVNSVFDIFPGARLATPFVIGRCLTNLQATPANYSTLEEALKRYIKVNSGEKESGAIFGMKKGVGVFRWKDQPVVETPSES